MITAPRNGPGTPAPARAGAESGVVLVLVALLVVAMLAVVAVVIDLGQGYADRRHMQNAADAAALAGARTLSQVRFNGLTADLDAAVRAVAIENGADASLVACDVIDHASTRLAPCAPANGWRGLSGAAGVRVTSGVRRPASFGGVVGVDAVEASAEAAATIQPLASARTPWMVCGNVALGGYGLLDPATGGLQSDTALRGRYGAGGTALPDPRGIPVFGKVTKLCGLSSNWKGGIEPGAQPVQLGTFVPADRGKQVGKFQYDSILAGVDGCPSDFRDGEFTSCLALIPVFDQVDTASQTARLAAFSVWRVHYDPTTQVKYWAQYVTAGLASGGKTSAGPVNGRSTFVVRLTR